MNFLLFSFKFILYITYESSIQSKLHLFYKFILIKIILISLIINYLMSSHEFNFAGLSIQYPHFDVLFKFLNNKEYFISHNFSKFFFLLGSILAVKFLVKFMAERVSYVKNLIKICFPLEKVNENKWICVIGFGDNETSVTISKYFANRGYNLLLLISNKVLKVRKEYNLNQIQQIDQLTHVKILEYDYETFVNSKDFNLNNGLIDYVFDTSVLRLHNEDLTEEDKNSHLESIFFNNAVNNTNNLFMSMLDKLRNHFTVKSEINPMKLFMFNYPDKNDEVNHKIFFEFRKSIYKQYQEIYKDTLVFNTIKFLNEFKGHYIKDSQLKQLEVLRYKGLGNEINFN